MFGWYLLWWTTQQENAPPAIVLDRGLTDSKYCFLRDGRVLKASSLYSFDAYIEDPSTWCVHDAKPCLWVGVGRVEAAWSGWACT